MSWSNRALSVWVCLIVLLVLGCSGEKGEDDVQEVIDYGTGKSQVDTYQRLRTQIKDIQQEREGQFEE